MVRSLRTMAGLKKSGEFTRALELVRAGVSPIFITGQAGTGKSTLLEHLKKKVEKQLAVVAPTGVAALNVGGQTIHSFFGFGPDITPHGVKRRSGKRSELYRKLELIIID